MAKYDQVGFTAPTPSSPGGFAQHDGGLSAAGSAGITAAMDAAPLASGVVVSVLGQSSQLAPDMATVSIGDTLSSSADATVPPSGDPLTGLSNAQLTQDGSGQGSVISPHHLGAAAVPSLAEQLTAARRPS